MPCPAAKPAPVASWMPAATPARWEVKNRSPTRGEDERKGSAQGDPRQHAHQQQLPVAPHPVRGQAGPPPLQHGRHGARQQVKRRQLPGALPLIVSGTLVQRALRALHVGSWAVSPVAHPDSAMRIELHIRGAAACVLGSYHRPAGATMIRLKDAGMWQGVLWSSAHPG